MKKLLACSVILLVALLFAGCDLFSQSTSGPVMTFVNGSETETIEELEVRVYLGSIHDLNPLSRTLWEVQSLWVRGKK